MLGRFPVEGLVHLVEDDVEEVEMGDERWWEINVASHGQVRIIF